MGKETDIGVVRSAVHVAISQLKTKKLTNATWFFPSDLIRVFGTLKLFDAVARVSVLSNHVFDKYLDNSNSQSSIHTLTIVTNADVKNQAKINDALSRGQAAAEGTLLARELANDRADFIDLDYLEYAARRVAEMHGLKMHTLAGPQLLQQNLHLISAVGQGASNGPRIITLEYRGDPTSEDVTALVGKGSTQ